MMTAATATLSASLHHRPRHMRRRHHTSGPPPAAARWHTRPRPSTHHPPHAAATSRRRVTQPVTTTTTTRPVCRHRGTSPPGAVKPTTARRRTPLAATSRRRPTQPAAATNSPCVAPSAAEERQRQVAGGGPVSVHVNGYASNQQLLPAGVAGTRHSAISGVLLLCSTNASPLTPGATPADIDILSSWRPAAKPPHPLCACCSGRLRPRRAHVGGRPTAVTSGGLPPPLPLPPDWRRWRCRGRCY